MGAGIAQVCLLAGHEVVLNDVDEAAIARGRERIAEGLDRAVAKGKLDAGIAIAADARLRDAHGLDAVGAEADLVIEAALEDMDLKRTIFRALGAAARPDAILATNTSALSVTDIADATAYPDRVLGLHFFNPAPVMALVEVVAAGPTSRDSVEAAVAFVTELGKTPVVCRDAPGFIVNRVNRPFTLEALRLVDRGMATTDEVDRAVEGAGYPMGPFRLMDLVGIDVNLAVARVLYGAFQSPRFRPSPLQEQKVEAGHLGRKTGRGFYRYGADAGAEPADLAATARAGAGMARRPLSPDAIVERIELAIVNEAYHAVGEDVAAPMEIDLAMKLGAGHPVGPFELAGAIGLRAVIEGLERLALSGEPDANERFSPAPALWSVAHL
jgi:3-hydroxybutyryl-CoA dehydrogenase